MKWLVKSSMNFLVDHPSQCWCMLMLSLMYSVYNILLFLLLLLLLLLFYYCYHYYCCYYYYCYYYYCYYYCIYTLLLIYIYIQMYLYIPLISKYIIMILRKNQAHPSSSILRLCGKAVVLCWRCSRTLGWAQRYQRRMHRQMQHGLYCSLYIDDSLYTIETHVRVCIVVIN